MDGRFKCNDFSKRSFKSAGVQAGNTKLPVYAIPFRPLEALKFTSLSRLIGAMGVAGRLCPGRRVENSLVECFTHRTLCGLGSRHLLWGMSVSVKVASP
ncbi:hypothetical protein BaRGS_00011576 [Batillaria attramentaria]|uniref:Cytochrome P450 n=1 Tax=Batillaria attramentaria TaxID=370345 RepID=A0ABD0LCI0_9CAEN